MGSGINADNVYICDYVCKPSLSVFDVLYEIVFSVSGGRVGKMAGVGGIFSLSNKRRLFGRSCRPRTVVNTEYTTVQEQPRPTRYQRRTIKPLTFKMFPRGAKLV